MTIGIDVRLWAQTGIGRYIRNLIGELLEIDHKNQYVLFARPEDIADIKTISNKKGTINPIIIPTSIKWHSIKEQIDFPRLLNKYQLDLMHFPYFSVPIFYNKPYVVTVHDLIINNFPTGRASTLPLPLYKLKRKGYRFVLKKALHDSQKIIVPSLATKDEILKEYKVKKDKIVVTPEGADDSISDFNVSLFKPKSPYFLYVGNTYPHKNIERLLDAFKIFISQYPTFDLYLVGKKDYFYEKLHNYVKKNNIENIKFLGYVTDVELAKYYAFTEATFIPSLMEGFGLTTLEAMKMGSLVASSKIPALKEVAGQNALYFDPTDILSIVKVMRDIVYIPEKDKKKMIEEAKKHASHFSWEKTARLTLDVYNSCL